MAIEPESYSFQPNEYCPNSNLPVLIYRDVLPIPLSEEEITNFLESHAWERRGMWGHIPTRHFHPNTHECYGVLSGESTMLVGCGKHSSEDAGQKLDLRAGDVIVLPAGTGHCNLESTKDYKYIGVYPKECPKWRNEYGKEPIDLDTFRQETTAVAMPSQDPVSGPEGPLMRLWGVS